MEEEEKEGELLEEERELPVTFLTERTIKSHRIQKNLDLRTHD